MGHVFYCLEDGNHRTEVSKMLGRKRIDAEIVSTTSAKPDDWRIVPGGLRHIPSGKERAHDIDVLAAAAWLGVKEVC
jgi:hypothetical protein